MAVRLNNSGICNFITDTELERIEPQVSLAAKMLDEEMGSKSWHNLPQEFDSNELEAILQAAEEIKNRADVFIVIGIGGSSLGAKAAIEWLRSIFYNEKSQLKIYFAGNNLSASYLSNVIACCEDKEVYINIVSKSGETLEPMLAFGIFRNLLEQKYGKIEASKRIFVTTDEEKGTLLRMAKDNGYRRFVIPEDIGGRYSVLTAVGLLPMAVAGIDIRQVMNGARNACLYLSDKKFPENESLIYAAYRNCLNRKGKRIEVLIGLEPDFHSFAEWFKQLFAESEGKDGKGIFPTAGIYSTDLHALGQFIQDSGSLIFETVIDVLNSNVDMCAESECIHNFGLAHSSLSQINKKVLEGALKAHVDAAVPSIVLRIPQVNEFEYGYLIYFFEKACAISALVLGVNPFNEPGVLAYKLKTAKLLQE
ncbi:MAG: glucose-6-phosphate isomerase [Oscillospiraceae bacterium]|jgi:glucose-6-phosphate isomerase|nr:glucose-6-phosphate isomerase [Oscillospiraceae bacterium]